MDPFELQALWLENRRQCFTAVPVWAKREQLAQVLPLRKIWQMSQTAQSGGQSAAGQTKKMNKED